MSEFRIDNVQFEGVPDRIPRLRIKFVGRVTGVAPTPQRLALSVIPYVHIIGIAMSVQEENTIRFGDNLQNIQGQEMTYNIPLTTSTVELIEKYREHDVSVSISLQLRMIAASPAIFLDTLYAGGAYEISQDKWLRILEATGYRSGWIVEVERPDVEGWEKTVGFLRRAEERISARDAEGAIAQCRAAWNSIGTSIKDDWDEISAEIDRGSTKEGDYPAKSERIRNAMDWIRKFTHTGDHPESYAANMEDALVAYRLTISMMAYLSRKQVDAERHYTTTALRPKA